MSNQLPPIRPEGLVALLVWLAQKLSGNQPDHALLLRGLEQGRIHKGRIESDSRASLIVFDQRDKRERNPRFFDPEAVFMLRVIFAAKTHLRVDHCVLAGENGQDQERHYLTAFGDITLLRVIADAQPGEMVLQLDDHHVVQRANLAKRRAAKGETKRTHQGREKVKRKSLEAYDKLADGHWLRKALTREDYVWLLDKAFELLDRRPLGDALKEAAE